MKSDQMLKIAVGILILLLLLAGFWGFRLNTSNNKMKAENKQLNAEFDELRQLRKNLEREVDSLELAYTDLAAENDSLAFIAGEAQERVIRQGSLIRNLKRENATGKAAVLKVSNMREELSRLTSEKTDLMASMQSLQNENADLKAQLGALTEEVSSERAKNVALTGKAQQLEEEIDRLTNAVYKASAFRVELEKRNSKATAKSRLARRLKVSFDLLKVPPKYQGTHPIYLVVTNEQGTPVKEDNAIQAQINSNGQVQNIQAVKQQDVNIAANQRLSFNHEFDEKLERGYYKVLVYTDTGLLGGSSVRVR